MKVKIIALNLIFNPSTKRIRMKNTQNKAELYDKVKYPKATMVGNIIEIKPSLIRDEKLVTVRYNDKKEVVDLLSSFEILPKT